MGQTVRERLFTIAVLLLLLFVPAFGRGTLLLFAVASALAIGIVLLPRQRTRGALAAVIGCVVALGVWLARLALAR